jgi:hypothetical protein
MHDDTSFVSHAFSNDGLVGQDERWGGEDTE